MRQNPSKGANERSPGVTRFPGAEIRCFRTALLPARQRAPEAELPTRHPRETRRLPSPQRNKALLSVHCQRGCTLADAGGGRQRGAPVAQQHLHFLVVRRLVACGVLPRVLCLASPLVASRRELVGRQGARAWREGAGDDHAPLTVPALVALQHLGVMHDVLRAAQVVSRCHPSRLGSTETPFQKERACSSERRLTWAAICGSSFGCVWIQPRGSKSVR